jgi:hypothetical protein
MLILMPLATAGLALATPILLILTLLGHRSWWSRICVASCAGAALGLIMLYEISPDSHKAFNLSAVFGSAGVGAVFGLWAGAWWCFFFRGRAEQLANPMSAGKARWGRPGRALSFCPPCQRRLASRRAMAPALFTRRGPSLRWGDVPSATSPRRSNSAPSRSRSSPGSS